MMKLAIAAAVSPRAVRSPCAAAIPNRTMFPVITLVKALPRARNLIASHTTAGHGQHDDEGVTQEHRLPEPGHARGETVLAAYGAGCS